MANKTTDKSNVLDKKKDRKFCILLYPDSAEYDCNKVLEKMSNKYDVAYILHDKDVWNEEDEKQNAEHKAGELKKAHYHVVLRWTQGSPRYRSGLAKELGIDKRYIEPADKLDECLLYLVHYGLGEKHEYETKELKGDLAYRVKELIDYSADGREEGEKVEDLIDYIEQYEGVLSTSMFLRYVMITKQASVYKKYAYAFHRMIDEHNFHVREI